MNEIKEIHTDEELAVGQFVFIVQFVGEKKTINDTAFTTLQKLLTWAESMWTNMEPRITMDTYEKKGKVYATIEEQEELVANVFWMPLRG